MIHICKFIFHNLFLKIVQNEVITEMSIIWQAMYTKLYVCLYVKYFYMKTTQHKSYHILSIQYYDSYSIS